MWQPCSWCCRSALKHAEFLVHTLMFGVSNEQADWKTSPSALCQAAAHGAGEEICVAWRAGISPAVASAVMKYSIGPALASVQAAT